MKIIDACITPVCPVCLCVMLGTFNREDQKTIIECGNYSCQEKGKKYILNPKYIEVDEVNENTTP
jgi:hypothetical protein